MAASHCDGCGRATTACPGCRWEYDPPRFCPECGTRLAVLVTPAGHRGRCKVHGDTPGEDRSGRPPGPG